MPVFQAGAGPGLADPGRAWLIVPPQLVCRILCSMSRVWYGDQKKSTARRLSMPCSGVDRAWRVARGAWRMASGAWHAARGVASGRAWVRW